MVRISDKDQKELRKYVVKRLREVALSIENGEHDVLDFGQDKGIVDVTQDGELVRRFEPDGTVTYTVRVVKVEK